MHSPTTSYVSRVIALPPAVAQQVFDTSRAELGLRLTGRRRPSGRYLAAATAVVDALAAEIELRGLLALHPSHTTAAASTRQEVTASAWL